jgi:hypothetical protein
MTLKTIISWCATTRLLAAAALVCATGCIRPEPIPASLKPKAGDPLRLLADAAIVNCYVQENLADLYFGVDEPNLCLYPSALQQAQELDAVALAPLGAIYVVKRRVYVDGVDNGAYQLELLFPQSAVKRPVILRSEFSKELLGTFIDPRDGEVR